jgi:hypothetical protein
MTDALPGMSSIWGPVRAPEEDIDVRDTLTRLCNNAYNLGLERAARWHDKRAVEAVQNGKTVISRDSHGFMAEQIRALKYDKLF